MGSLRVFLIGISFISTVHAADVRYFNRKQSSNPEAEATTYIQTAIAEATRSGRWVRVLDFSPQDRSLQNLNIVRTEAHEIFFPEFLARVLAANSVIHIDHHYPFRILSQTSTSVMAVDFLIWLGRSDLPNKTELLQKFQDSVAIMDHSDVDILLSNVVMSKATDTAWLERHADLIKAAAIFNDYVREILPEEKQSQARLLFYMVNFLDQQIMNGKISIEQGLEQSMIAVELVGGSQKEMEKFSSQEKELLRLLGVGKTIQSAAEILPGSLSAIGEILIVYPGIEMDGSTSLLVLGKQNSPLTQNAKVLLTISIDPNTRRTFFKLRAKEGGRDLSSLYPALQVRGLDAGGRASAGSAAFGKAGAENLSLEDLQKTLAIFIETYESWAKSCELQLAKIN